jgi:hypothetical protein
MNNVSLIPCPDFIGGEWLARAGGTPVFNPSTEIGRAHV